MPRRKRVLDDPIRRRAAAKAIAADVRRGDDHDDLGELNPLDRNFFQHAGVHVFIPIADDVACKRALLFLRDEIDGLLSELNRLPSRRSKSLLAHSKLQRWSQSFKRLVKPPDRTDD